MADGGDQLYVLTQGGNRLGGTLDLDTLESCFITTPLVQQGTQNRIVQVP